MVLLTRKRIFIILSGIIFSVITFIFFTTNNTAETAQTVALPVSNKVIVLDAGHGIPDERCSKQKWNYRS